MSTLFRLARKSRTTDNDLPAESRGYSVSRSVFRPDGTVADLSKARQTDLFVVVIKGTRSMRNSGAGRVAMGATPATASYAASCTG